ncbi:MAG TPA: LPS-assembly protein LptD [Burkholderiaceae bacterium]|jgi:LPS-assembly protein|nr:LPS-assembly protein LptD [Burkholderiaceae bacterium]
MAVLALVAGSPAMAQSAPVVLKLERALGAHRAPGHVKVPTYASADRMHGEVDERVQMDGAVELRSAGVVMRGDSAEYLCASDEAKVRGNARLYDRGTMFSGPSLDYRLEARSGQMPEATYSYSPRQGRGESSLIEFLDEDHFRLHNATYTNCAPGDDAWWIKADTLDIDRQEQQAIGHHATMYFQGVPVISSPYFSMPLGGERRSGILTPSYYFDSRSGFQVTVPYYWNMAPNYDYTITPALYPRWGALLGNEFRLLEPTVRGVIDYDVMPYDRKTSSSREHTMVNGTYNGGSGLSAGINYNRVSDDLFLTDFSHSLAEAAPIELPQNEYVSYSRTYWNATVQVARNQTLFSLLNPPGTPKPGNSPPYDRVPDFTLNSSRTDWRGFDLAATVDATRFRNETLEEGSRFIANPSLSYPVLSAAYFLVPRVQWHLTEYELDPNLHSGQSSATRSLPITSVDAGLVFERPGRFLGRSATQTLEPRLFYAYIPFRDQSRLPNFDSADPTFTFAQLFTENAFTGNDRIGEANQVTTALVSRMIDEESGAERLRMAVGQRFYFGPQRVFLPGEPTRTNLTSDLLLEASAQTSHDWKGEFDLEYSAVDSQFVRADVGIRWQPKASSVVDLSYRYQSATLHQIDLATQWPLSRKWYAVTNLNYSLLGRGGLPTDPSFTSPGRTWVETVLGFEYKADCWVGRLVAQRYSTDGGITRTTTIFLQIDLNGFSSFGTRSPLEQLRRSIPGYQRVNPQLPAPGPFENYE